MNAISHAIELCGGQSALAKAIHVSSGLVGHWARGERPIAADRCPSIEAATGGKVRAEALRPDVEWQRDGGLVTGYVVPVHLGRTDSAEAA